METNKIEATVPSSGLREVPREQVVMAFVSTCVEATARTLGVGFREVYDRMNRLGVIDKYIYPCYETLHTESRENVVDDILKCMDEWEAKRHE